MLLENTCSFFSSDWGNLVFFDNDEMSIMMLELVGSIPKLRPQWKIIHKFQPLSYETQTRDPAPVSMRIYSNEQLVLTIDFPVVLLPSSSAQHMRLSVLCRKPCNRDYAFILCQQPLLGGDWSKIEIIHEENEGRYTLVMAVEGQEMGRMDVGSPILRNLTDVKIYIGSGTVTGSDSQHGNIRDIVALDKQ